MKIMILGLGSMGKRRIRNLKTLGYTDLIGADLQEERRTKVTDEYGVPTFDTFEKGMAENPDAVVISLPPDIHVPFARKVVAAGKPFFKEASVTLDGMDSLVRETRERKLIAFPSCTMRYFPGPVRIGELVREGRVGRPLLWAYQCGQYLPDWHPWEPIENFYVSKRETGGAREIVPFEMEWLVHVFGEIESLSGQVGKLSDLHVDIDDTYQVLLKQKGGTAGSLIVEVLARPAVRLFRLTGSEGTLIWDHQASTIRIHRPGDEEWTEEKLEVGTPESGYISPEEPYIREMKEFTDCVKEKREPEYRLEDDRRILQWLYASEESSRSGARAQEPFSPKESGIHV